MEIIHIPATSTTPVIAFNFITGELSITGRSYSENPFEFYHPLLKKIEEYILNPQLKTTLLLHIEYMGTASVKCLFAILKKLKAFALEGNSVSIKWLYVVHDEDMLQTGHEFSELLEMPFEFIESPALAA